MPKTLRLSEELEEDLDILSYLHERSEHGEMVYALKTYIAQHREEIEAEKRRRVYCPVCKTTPCEVIAGNTCCHDRVRYGTCQHKTEEELAQAQADAEDAAEQEEEARSLDAVQPDPLTGFTHETTRPQGMRPVPRPKNQQRPERPKRSKKEEA